MTDNPLQKYYRQPKIYLELPSGGTYYPPGTIDGDPSKLPVFGMSAMDEIMFKTPDALFNGDATVDVIKSCIPGIMQPWFMPQLDVDACLIAIRIATYGQMLETRFDCEECGEENKIDLDLTKSLEYFGSLEYETTVIAGPLLVTIRPLTYKEATDFNIKSFELRRKLYQTADLDISEEEKNKQLNEVYKQIGKLTADGYKRCIASVEADDAVVTDPAQISDWLTHSDKSFFDKITDHLAEQSQKWKLQEQTVNCANCNHVNKVSLGLDNSNFFVKR
jgi:transcription elongation factor Elf1